MTPLGTAQTRVEAAAQADRRGPVRGRPPPRRACCTPCSSAPRSRPGALRGVDAAAARALPGVTAVLTAADLPDFPQLAMPAAVLSCRSPTTGSACEGQPVAIVLASRSRPPRQARAAVAVDCERETPVLLGRGSRDARDGRGRRRLRPRATSTPARAQAAVARRADLRPGRRGTTTRWRRRRRSRRWDGDRAHPVGRRAGRARPSSRSSAPRSASTRRTCASSPRTPAAASAARATSGRTRSWPPRPPGWRAGR